MEKETLDVVDSRGRKRSEAWTENDEPSLTVQSDADKADIGKILSRYAQVGIVDHLNMAQGMFMDVTEFTDLADAMRQSKVAEVEFLKLPSKVREIFNHDVAEWLDAAHDPDKRAKLEEAGFIEAKEIAKEPAEPAVVPPVAVVPVDDEVGTE